jgi:plastocyanin
MRAPIQIAASMVISCVTACAADERTTPRTHTITMEKMRFQPQSLTVASGDTIVWVNKDLVPHTATSQAGGFDSQVIPADKSWRFTPRARGEFAYICVFHPTMTATLNIR